MRKGGKVHQLTYDNEGATIPFIDSLSFFTMQLSAFPKTFGLRELKKGFFPPLFNMPDNQDYHGPIPDAANVLHNHQFQKNSTVINFVKQHRCQDPLFQELIDNIRHYLPTANILKALHGNRILFFEEPSDQDIFQVLKDMPDALFLTVEQ